MRRYVCMGMIFIVLTWRLFAQDTGSIIYTSWELYLSWSEDNQIISNTSTNQTKIPHYNKQDMVIDEVFSYSGACLDEYIIIESRIIFSGIVDISWLWYSKNTITISLELMTGERVLITDNLNTVSWSGKIIWVDEITLSNAWEELMLSWWWFEFDHVYYKDPHGPKSLFYSSESWDVRLLYDVWSPSILGHCIDSQIIWAISDACIIGVGIIQWKENGASNLSVYVTGYFWELCRTADITGTWYIDGSLLFNGCEGVIELTPWNHIIKYIVGTGICSDTFAVIWNTQYIPSFYARSWQCQTNIDTKKSTNIDTIFETKNCGFSLQSPKSFFYSSHSINIALLLDDIVLTDSQKRFECSIDMGNGDVLYECNPSYYRYSTPWIYIITSQIRERDTKQSVCKSNFFINVPPMYGVKDIEAWWGSSEICEQWLTWLSIKSILANPVWSDSLYERIIVDTDWFSGSLSGIWISINKTKLRLSDYIISWGIIVIEWWLWLRNDGMCISLQSCSSSKQYCYPKVLEWIQYVCTYDNNCILDDENNTYWLDINKQCVVKDSKTYIQLKEKYDLLSEKYRLKFQKQKQQYTLSLIKLRASEKLARNSMYVYRNTIIYLWKIISKGNISKYVFDDLVYTIHSIIEYQKNGLYVLRANNKKKVYIYDVWKFIEWRKKWWPLNIFFSDQVSYFEKLELQLQNKKL